jgi:hypothetical protein
MMDFAKNELLNEGSEDAEMSNSNSNSSTADCLIDAEEIAEREKQPVRRASI